MENGLYVLDYLILSLVIGIDMMINGDGLDLIKKMKPMVIRIDYTDPFQGIETKLSQNMMVLLLVLRVYLCLSCVNFEYMALK